MENPEDRIRGTHRGDVGQRPLERWLERLYDLRRDKHGDHERPHKPVLLLAIIHLVDRGDVAVNRVQLTEELESTFRRYFEVVRRHDDQPTIQNPYFHLCGDRLWSLVPLPGQPGIYQQGQVTGAPSVGQLRRRVQYGQFDPEFWRLMRDKESRGILRESLIARYFPEHRSTLLNLVGCPAADALKEDPDTCGRDTAFRKLVLNLYDHRCAACGVRVRVQPNDSLVEAAHLIPWSISHDDNPSNGISLCRNHHWAMDRNLIAPCPDGEHRAGIWRVSRKLDNRIEGQELLLKLHGIPVIEPVEAKFLPAAKALEWREKELSGKY